MSGWKTYLAGIGGILTGLGMIGAGLQAKPYDFDQIQNGAMAVFASLGVLGIGHKIEKAAAVAAGPTGPAIQVTKP